MPKLVINDSEYTPKMILFDVDGTLVDDRHRYSSLGKARYQVFAEKASEKAAKEWARLSGVNSDDWTIDPLGPISKAPRRDDLAIAASALYLEGYNWYEARALAEEIYAGADKIQEKTFKPVLYEGVKEKLGELNKVFMLGVATNGQTGITVELLKGLGIDLLFSVVVGADTVERSKPAPDMIVHACKIAKVPLSEMVYVGDQPTDIAAAKSAGAMASVAVRNTVEDATENLDSVADLASRS